MAADTASSDAPPPCPDPSAHDHHNKLSAQASTAALYVTSAQKGSHSRNSSIQSESVLGPDGKLSSKSAATSLKYAKAQDLPSFPSTGNASGSAGKAAMLAQDYKMKELWQPEQSKAGSKAALLAANKGGKVDLWQASATPEGQSAATLAFRNKGLSPQAYGGNSAENKSKALLAATKSTQQSRARATSTPSAPPQIYPDQANSGKNALNAATVSHRQSVRDPGQNDGWNSEANQAARVTHLGENVSGKMFTGTPDWQYEEDKHQAALKASAITMAQSLYKNQNRQNMLLEPDGSDLAGARSAARNQAVAHPDVKQEALQYISLQDTAHRLAAERLAKIDKDMEGKRFREHYGYGDEKPKRLSSRMSLRSSGNERRGRQRASSEGNHGRFDSDSDSEDERQAGRIRAQMAGLNTATRQVDSKKQQDDRAKLLAAAEKRVSARMQDMDSKVYRDTGKVSPAMMEEWEAKAREKAERERQERALNPGKTHIGGGQFMDQSEIEAIAAARLKPTLDEISATAANRRQRDEELRIEKDKQHTARMEEKISQQAEKDKQRAIKNDLRDSARREKAEEKRVAREEQRKSREVKRDTVGSNVLPVGGVEFGRTHEVHDQPTEDTPVTDGREKHQSALARLKAKFRTTGSHEKAADKDADNSASSGTVVAGGAAAGAVTGATLANLEKDGAPIDAQQASHAVAADEGATKPPALSGTTDGADTPVLPLAENEKQLATAGDSPYEAEWKAGGAAPTAATTVIPAPAIQHADSDSDADGEESLYENKEKATRPTFAQTGSVSGFANDTIPTASGGGDRMATLERHISHIPESDGSSLSSSDDDWNDERTSRAAPAAIPGDATHETLTTPTVQEPSVAPLAAAGAAAPTTHSEAEHPPRTMTDVYDSTTAPVTTEKPANESEPPYPANIVSAEATSRLEEQCADPPAGLATGPQTPGVPRDTSAPDTASIVAIPPASVTSSPTTGAATLKQKIKGEENVPAVVGVPAHDTTKSTEPLHITENADNGPLDHPLVAAAEPSTAPAAEFSKKEAEKTSQPISTTNSDTKHQSEKEGKGVRGFFSKLRSKSRSEKSPGTITAGSSSKYDESKHDSKSVPYESTKAGQTPTTNDGTYDKAATAAAVKQTLASQTAGTTTTASTIPPIDTGAEFSSSTVQHTDAPAAESSKVVGTTEAESPSSFTRGETKPSTTDDVSSSGADEEDLERGRGGSGRSFAKKLGFGRNKDAHTKDGKLHKPAPGTEAKTSSEAAGRASRSTDDENDNFEEARDHFDESLAPPPAFGGQKKSQSPVRETKFKEDV
ncbi:Putative eisosome protein [Septoria linicola]|uniref:Eisosome protein n=1 Tax=Septoria linicola TaxID=215465 RepID=A0A9Q9ENA9_9PEZI|nr:putative eisosome protein [Septoria linicola]USW57616.1 Putative eisosome protein [Septoria linicola]